MTSCSSFLFLGIARGLGSSPHLHTRLTHCGGQEGSSYSASTHPVASREPACSQACSIRDPPQHQRGL